MKKISFLFVGILFILLHSCDNSEIDGIWSDIIKFNTKEAKFEATGGTQKITSKGDWWWILNYISNGQEYTNLQNNPDIHVEMGKIKGWDNPNAIYDEGADMEIKKIEGTWYTITKDTYQSLIIETKPNDTGKFRSFVLHIEAGNYFDYITISQSAN